ncbi:unnamed protein product, partial [Rotaria sp. Silwood1]
MQDKQENEKVDHSSDTYTSVVKPITSSNVRQINRLRLALLILNGICFIIVTGFHRQLISCKATSSVNIFCIFIQLLLSCSTLELKSNKCYAFSTNFNERVDRILVDADFS